MFSKSIFPLNSEIISPVVEEESISETRLIVVNIFKAAALLFSIFKNTGTLCSIPSNANNKANKTLIASPGVNFTQAISFAANQNLILKINSP